MSIEKGIGNSMRLINFLLCFLLVSNCKIFFNFSTGNLERVTHKNQLHHSIYKNISLNIKFKESRKYKEFEERFTIDEKEKTRCIGCTHSSILPIMPIFPIVPYLEGIIYINEKKVLNSFAEKIKKLLEQKGYKVVENEKKGLEIELQLETSSKCLNKFICPFLVYYYTIIETRVIFRNENVLKRKEFRIVGKYLGSLFFFPNSSLRESSFIASSNFYLKLFESLNEAGL